MSILKKTLAHSSFHIGILILRVWLGVIIIKHSTHYLFGGKMQEFTSFLTSLDFPFPETMAYLSQGTEFVAGLLIILGFKVGAILLALNMSIAVFFAHKMLVFTEGELAFNYFILALVIAVLGTGKYGFDQLILNRINIK